MTIKTWCKIWLTVSIILLGSIHKGYGQNFSDPPILKFGFDVSIGTTTKQSPYGYGLGIDLVLDYKLAEKLIVTGGVGYGRLLTKDTSPIPDYDFIPLKTAVKILPIYVPIYVTGFVGTGFGLKKGIKTSFLFGGGVGYDFLNNYEVGIKYEAYHQRWNKTTYQPLNGQFALIFSYYF